MSGHVTFVNHTPRTARIPRAVFCRALRVAQRIIPKKLTGELSVVFVSPAQSKKLNTLYRGKKKPTNVLSFVANEKGMLGDIIICPLVAKKEATIQDIVTRDWLLFLFVHGLLHLAGYDHQTNAEERTMDRLTQKIIDSL